MATSHLMAGRYVPQFGLNSSILILSFGEMFSYFATSWKWYCVPFWIDKKSRLFRRFFQYPVIFHSSKHIKLALTDFNRNRVFYRNCMWLQLRQILKKRKTSPKETRENSLSVLLFVLMLTSFERAQITWAFVLRTRAIVKLQVATLSESPQ